MAVKLMPVASPALVPHAPNEEKGDKPAPRKRRKAAVYDAEGHEVLISLTCLKCHTLRPLSMFGLRKMADGAIRNQPWCRVCRGSSGTKKKGEATTAEAATPAAPAPATEPQTSAPPASVADSIAQSVVMATEIPAATTPAAAPAPVDPHAAANLPPAPSEPLKS